MDGFEWGDFASDLFGGSAEDLSGLHVSRAGDFYWPSDGGVSHFPPGAPALTAGQVWARVQTDEIRKV